MEMHWVYHATETAKIVNFQEYEKLLADGWSDTPDLKPVEKKKPGRPPRIVIEPSKVDELIADEK